MNSKSKQILATILRILCIPFMLIGIAVWGAAMFAKIGIETLARRKERGFTEAQ